MADEQQYGGFWARAVALVVDNAVVFVVLLVVAFAMGMVAGILGMEGMAEIIGWVAMTVVPFLYWPLLESSGWQATVGKRLMGLQVTDLEGNRLSFVHALLRAFAKIVSGIPFGIGFLIAAFTARKQALHDIIVKTLVVRSGPSQLWKILLALIVGVAVMVASAAGLFYYVLMPMFKGGIEGAMKDSMKGAPQMKTIPSPAPAGKAPPAPQPKPAAPQPQPKAEAPAPAAAKPEAAPAPAPALAAPVKPEPAPVVAAPSKPAAAPARPEPRPRAESRPAPVAAPAPPRPLDQADSGCVYKPVMTDAEIARCR